VEALFAWLEAKARNLIRLANLSPAVVGTRCPFCAWVLPRGQLLNDLVDHVCAAHPGQQVRSVNLGEPTTITTDTGVYTLEDAEDFGQ
jgi:hypothetical protein